MEMPDQPKNTPLYEWHVAHGANMVMFSGWNMPLWYPTGAVTEHQAVITNAGIFDTSHMSVVMVKGPGAFDILQLCFTRDLAASAGNDRKPLEPGRCLYGAFLNEQGEVLDDATVYPLSPENYMVVVNAGMGPVITGHLSNHAHGLEVRLTDLTAKVGKIDLQGPMSGRILMRVLEKPLLVLGDMSYFSFKGHYDKESGLADTLFSDGTPLLISRTGYTGEFGFEIFVAQDKLNRAWDMILRAGSDLGVIPCGLAARDSLRAGACLPLSHQDIGAWPFINNPWPFGLPYNQDGSAFTKKFIGDQVLGFKEAAEYTHAFVGYDPRKVSVHDPAVVLDRDGNEIGVVLTCVSDMAIGRSRDRIYSMASPDKPLGFKPLGLSCGFVKVNSKLFAGQELELKDKRRKIKVVIVDDIRPDRTARRPIDKMLY